MTREFLKKLKYLSLVCIIVFGLVAVIGSGGSGGGGDDEVINDPSGVSSSVTRINKHSPQIKDIGNKIALVGLPLAFSIEVMDLDRDKVTIEVRNLDRDKVTIADPNLPEGAKFNSETNTFTWTPEKQHVTEHPFYDLEFVATDDGEPVKSSSDYVRIKVYDEQNISNELIVTIDKSEAITPANIKLELSVEDEHREPVPGLNIVDNFFVIEDGAEPSIAESNLTMFPHHITSDLYTLIMVDLSGSITGKNMVDLKTALTNLINELYKDNEQVAKLEHKKTAIWYFQTAIHQVIDFTNDKLSLLSAINSLDSYIVPGATTNLYGSFIEGIENLDDTVPDPNDVPGNLIVITDGKDQAGKTSFDQALAKVKATKHKVWTVGIDTEEFEEAPLKQLGEERCFLAENYSELVEKLLEALMAIEWQNGKYYTLVYASPKRSGTPTVEVEVEDSLERSGIISYNFSAGYFYDGGYDQIEELKIQYYDFDGDGYYSIDGPLHDCNDTDPDNWKSCSTRVDSDNDGYCGSGCDKNLDCDDNDSAINPSIEEIKEDGIDQDCSSGDAILYEGHYLIKCEVSDNEMGIEEFEMIFDIDKYEAVTGTIEYIFGLSNITGQVDKEGNFIFEDEYGIQLEGTITIENNSVKMKGSNDLSYYADTNTTFDCTGTRQ